MSTNWSPSELLLLRTLVQQCKNDAEIATVFREERIRRTYKAIQRMRQRQGWHAMIAANPSCAPRFDKPLHIEADRALLMFDPHAPFHDADWCNRVIGLALSYDVDTAAVAGDLVDFTAFSKWGRQERVEAEDEIASAIQFIKALCASFKRLIYSAGNHENRLPRITGNLLALRNTMEMFINGTHTEVTDYHWFELISGGEKYYIEHPKNASINATVVPKKLASKYLCHVVAGHGHLWGITRDPSNSFWCIDSGVCADPERLAYTRKVHSTRPKEVQDAVLILDGIPILLSPDNIQWYERR